ncbi:MAG: TipAS antibiotic-recognition domain-containing protein, partial [Lawsonibacter sp.]|nr:TipAS antibiotic-recognition domain-containing protein [Lawsonibacter sp.]
TKTEIEKMFQLMFDSMTEEMRQAAIGDFGSVEQWKTHYMEVISSADMQKRYAKVVEWYGGKDAYLDTLQHPISKDIAESYKKREDAIRQKLLAKRGCDLNSFEVKQIIGEYGFVMKQVCQMKEEKGLMLTVAQSYRNEQCRQAIDQQYGDGAAEFLAQAIEAFYRD